MSDLVKIGAAVTMSSLEIVDLINKSRKEGEAELAHSDFLKKVHKVLGESVAGNFSCYYTASNGKQNPCYRFPKRESCLMAMSYSYELQAAVFDRMTELEDASKPKTISPEEALEFAKVMTAMYKELSESGLHPAAAEMVKDLLHNNFLQSIGVPLISGNTIASGPKILGCVEIARRAGLRIPDGYEQSFGRRVADKFRNKARDVERLVKGEIRRVKVYPEECFDDIEDIARLIVEFHNAQTKDSEDF